MSQVVIEKNRKKKIDFSRMIIHLTCPYNKFNFKQLLRPQLSTLMPCINYCTCYYWNKPEITHALFGSLKISVGCSKGKLFLNSETRLSICAVRKTIQVLSYLLHSIKCKTGVLLLMFQHNCQSFFFPTSQLIASSHCDINSFYHHWFRSWPSPGWHKAIT